MPFPLEAQRKGGKNSKPGKHARTKQWELLGEHIATTHANRFNNILTRLDDEEFVKAYGMILNYFKPRLQSTQMQAKIESVSEVEIHLKSPEWEK